MDARTIAILSGSIVILTLGLAWSLLCIFAPKKAILLNARYSMLVDEDSASDRWMILRYRIMGIVQVVFVGFFALIIVVKFLDLTL
jgi:hypothetical protein